MEKSYLDYLSNGTEPDIPAEPAATADDDIMQRWEKAAELKEIIARQIEQGNDPETLLYTALHCIGLLSNDSAWEQRVTTELDTVYGDLMQISIYNDEAIIAKQRMIDKYNEYQQKLSAQLQRQYDNARHIEKELLQALVASRELELQDALTE